MTFGPGCAVTGLVTLESMSSTVMLRNLPAGTSVHDLRSLIQTIMDLSVPVYCIRLQSEDNDCAEATVRLSNSAEAESAAKGLDKLNYRGTQLSCSLLESASDITDSTKILCAWFLPSRLAYLEFASEADALNAVRSATTLCSKTRKLDCIRVRGDVRYPVLLRGLDLKISEDILRDRFPSQVSVTLKPPRYDEPLYQIKAMIQSLFETHSRTGVEFTAISGEAEMRQRAVVTFEEPSLGERLYGELIGEKQSFLGGQTLDLKLFLSTKMRIRCEIYRAISPAIQDLVNKDPPTNMWIWEKENRPVWLTMNASDRESLARIKTTIMKLMRGSPVCDPDGQKLWADNLNFPYARRELRTVASTYGVHIDFVSRTRTVVLYGSPEACAQASAPLLRAHHDLKNQLLQSINFRFPAATTETHRLASIATLKRQYGEERVSTNDKLDGIQVRCEGAEIPAIRKLLGTQQPVVGAPSNLDDCVICLCEAEDPITTTCAHRYCKTCFQESARQATAARRFPLSCFAVVEQARSEPCGVPIDLFSIQQQLSAVDLEVLQLASLEAWVQKRQTELYFCPTPDCSSIFAALSKSTELKGTRNVRNCPQCLVATCRYCYNVAHPTMTCEEHNMTDDDKLDAWKNVHNVKQCPKCKVNIEKNDGCNHMTCSACDTHFCWTCGEEQPHATIYTHMAICTGPKPGPVQGGIRQQDEQQARRDGTYDYARNPQLMDRIWEQERVGQRERRVHLEEQRAREQERARGQFGWTCAIM